MRKILFFITLLVCIISCHKEEENSCSPPLPVFTLAINKKSEPYKEFINKKGEIDEKNITLYKLLKTEKKEYKTHIYYDSIPTGNVYLNIITQLWFKNDVYTGKTETLYLQNASKTYKIEVNGYMKETECGDVAVINEMHINGEKIEVPYLAK